MKILLAFLFCLPASIYSLQFVDSNGATVSMSSFQGKKILLVNIATGSTRVNQLGQLQQLKQQYGDSLVIIGFPSNSFGHEARTDQQISAFCQSTYGVTFLLAAKNPVTGAAKQPVYNWLSSITENGTMDGEPGGDFQKFLLNSEGKIIGVFAPSVSPLDSVIINAINEN